MDNKNKSNLYNNINKSNKSLKITYSNLSSNELSKTESNNPIT